MPLKNYAKRSALAQKYGWSISGWAVDLDNPAGILLSSLYDGSKFLRFQHSDSLEKWEKVLRENKQIKPKNFKQKPRGLTFDER